MISLTGFRVQVFSKIDLWGVCKPICICEVDKWKLPFHTWDGNFKYLVMPFGLSNVSTVFQEFVPDIFQSFLYVCVVAYLDDILVFSLDLSTH